MKKVVKAELICSHRVVYWWNDGEERFLNEINIEHIQTLLMENRVAGVLCQNDPETKEIHNGWWQI